jgi:predicted dehydrogenase
MADHPPLNFAAIGLDHRHIYHQVGRLIELGAECNGYYIRDSAAPLEGFVRRFPALRRVRDVRALLEDPEVQLIVTAAIPSERAEIALEAMRHGKDVMVDKPGVITKAQLADIMHLQPGGSGRSISPSASRSPP